MSGYIEVLVKGGHRAFLEVGGIGGVIVANGMSAQDPATPEQTLSIIIRGGDTLEGVYGVSAMKIMLYVEGAKLLMREKNRFCVVAFLDSISEFEAEINAALLAREMVGG